MKLLPVGQPVELTLQGVELEAPLLGAVQESLALDECVVSLKPPGCPIGWVLPGESVRLRFSNIHGLHGASASIMDMKPGPPIELRLGEFHDETTLQRRAYYRVNRGLPAVVTVLASFTTEAGKVDNHAFTFDLSGSGIKLDTVLALGPEDRIWVTVTIPQRLQAVHSKTLQVRAEVQRIEPVVRGGMDFTRVATKFLFRRDIDQDAWVRLVLDLQKQVDEE